MRELLVQYYNELKQRIGDPYWDVEARYGVWPAERFREKIEECVPQPMRPRLEDVLFCALPITEGNTFAIRAPDGGALLCIDTALQVIALQFAFSFLVASSASFRLPFQPESWKGADQMVRCAKTLRADLSTKKGLIELYSGPLATDFKHFREVGNKDIEKTGLVGDITMGMFLFALLHETYHFLCGHLDKERLLPFSISDRVRVLIYTKQQRDELEADREALSALLRWKPKQAGYLVACAETLFLLLRLCEALGPSKLPLELRTHPPAAFRIEELRRIYVSHDDRLKANAEDFDAAYDVATRTLSRGW
jgi:hypothetical protein